MPLPVAVSLVEEVAGLTPSLFNMPDQPTLDAFVGRFVARADAWMQGHMGGNYNITSPTWAATLQEEGQLYLALEKLSGALRSLKVQGTHFPYVQEDSPAFQALIETDWGEMAIAALDLWVTPEIAAGRAFAMPQLLFSDGFGPLEKLNDSLFPSTSEQLSEELDWARALSDADIGTLRR